MPEPLDTPSPGARRPGRKRLVTIVALLFALTVAGAHAARLATRSDPGDAGPGGDLARSASHGAVGFAGRLDRGAVHVGSDGRVHLELTATGAAPALREAWRRPTDVVVVLDRSGSMQGDPLAKALAAIRELIGELDGEDRLALVAYANGAEDVLPLAPASGEARARWLARLATLGANGGTNMSAGLDRAHALLAAHRAPGRVARVLLLSDGHANQGDATPEGLARRATRAIPGEYVLSTVGVGEGFDERLMSRLADAGTGNFYYVPDVEVLAGIFADEFDAARETVASALEIRIDTPSGVEVLDAAGYPIEQRDGHAVIRPGALFAGQQRSFWVTLRVPAERAAEIPLGRVELAWTPVDGGARERLRLPALPTIEAVADASRFAASLDGEAVATHHAEEVVNRVQQSIAELVSRGDYGAARQRLDDVDFDELRAAGIAPEATESFVRIEEMKDELEKAAAAPAREQPALRNQLGKTLYEAGTDGRRKGAKR